MYWGFRRRQSRTTPIIRTKRAIPPITPPTIAPTGVELFFVSAEEAWDVEAAVMAGIPGGIERVREGEEEEEEDAVDEDVTVVVVEL